MKKLLKIFFISGPGFLLLGCLASDKDMEGLRLQIAGLNKTLASVQANQADLSAKMDDLGSEISINNENLQETGEMITRLSSKLDDLSVATAAVAQMQAETRAVTLPTTIFENAKKNLDAGKNDSAIEGFNLYLTKFPQGELLEDANYYIGDAYFAKKDYREAALQYAKLMQKYPKSKRLPAYRLKYARAIIPLNKKTEAKQYLQSIAQDFPKSSEAKVAARELAALK